MFAFPTEYYLKFIFYLKVQSTWSVSENNLNQVAVSVGNAVAHTIGPIFKHTIDCRQLHLTKYCSLKVNCLIKLNLTCRHKT